MTIVGLASFGQNNILVIDYNNNFSSDQNNNNSIIYNRLVATQTSVTRVGSIPASINPATYNQVWIFGNMGTPTAAILNPVVTYMNAGGAVYVQSEVSCCPNPASFLDQLINATVTVGGSITHSATLGGYYEVTYLDGCVTRTTYGAACRPFPGTPAANILFQATATCGGTMTGKIAAVKFRNCDMISGKGALVGIGDFNVFPSGGACGSVGILGTPNRNQLIDYLANLLPSLLTCSSNTTPSFDIRDTALCSGPVPYKSPLVNPAYKYLWSNGNTTDSTAYNTPGKHWLRIEISPGCFISDTFTISFNSNAVISVNDTAICSGQSATLTAVPANTGGTYSWSPGGQTTQSINVTPGSTSNYIVSYNINGCIGSDTGTVTINALPSTDFTFDTACLGTPTCFQDITTVPNSSVSGWSWIFGDGSPTDTTSNPCHTYSTVGNYSVSLITTSAQGCTGNKTHSITVNAVPSADFSTANVCLADVANFTDLSTITADSIVGWQWDFGNGSGTSTQKNPSYQYPAAGTYTVQLITSPSGGYACSDTITKQITIHPMPTADFNYNNICDGDSMMFGDQSAVGTGSIANWGWSFGDGQTGTNQNENHLYGQPGNYQVSLIVVTDSGCTDTVAKQVTVYEVPVADFGRSSVCEGEKTQFIDKTSLSIGQLQSWTWNFGDGSANQSGQNTSHLFPGTGSYTTTLIVSTSDGCIDSVSKTIWINPLPNVDFLGDTLDGCAPVCPSFTDQSTITTGSIATYQWDFGDNSTATGASASHCYENKILSPLSFDVTLTATSDSGCVSSETKTGYIKVYPYPIASFTTDYDVVKLLNPIFEYRDQSKGASSRFWDFGDGSTNMSDPAPTHQYKDTGKYVNWLYVENQWGCRDSTFKVLEVQPEFFIYIPNSFTPGSDGINDKWYPVAYGAEELKVFIYDRWGEVIWTGDLGDKWDGFYKGKRVKNDVYVYLVKARTVLGTDKEYRGKITVIE